MHITTYGGRDIGQYPLTLFPTVFRLVFTIGIPIACVGYYPVAALLGHESLPLWVSALMPLVVGSLFLYISCRLWAIGVRRYCSGAT